MKTSRLEKLNNLVPEAVVGIKTNPESEVGKLVVDSKDEQALWLKKAEAEEREYADRTSLKKPEEWPEYSRTLKAEEDNVQIKRLYSYEQIKALLD